MHRLGMPTGRTAHLASQSNGDIDIRCHRMESFDGLSD